MKEESIEVKNKKEKLSKSDRRKHRSKKQKRRIKIEGLSSW